VQVTYLALLFKSRQYDNTGTGTAKNLKYDQYWLFVILWLLFFLINIWNFSIFEEKWFFDFFEI
jgi:hypothetical protein